MCRPFFNSVVLLAIVGCEPDQPLSSIPPPPVSQEPIVVDSLLIGEWYYLDTTSVLYPSPTIVFEGMQIAHSDTVRPLGIETETGKVGFIENPTTIILRRASNGVIIMHWYTTGIVTDSMQYIVQADTLILIRPGHWLTIFSRTGIDSALAPPIHSDLIVTIDSTIIHNPRVVRSPSAFLSKISASQVKLKSFIPEGWLTVDLDGFMGVGTYDIGPNQGQYTIWMGDVALTLLTDSSATGTITFNEFDETSNRCSGTFSYTARFRSLPSDPYFVRTLTGGSFSLPIYR